MLDGPGVVSALASCGVTHVVWLPDSELGQWESSLANSRDLRLIRVCREGEAMAIAAGLMLGGKRPVVMIQITGFFEAGDAFRNVAHDLKLPLFLVIGMRSWKTRETTADSCPAFAEPILKAWKLDYTWLGEDDLASAYRRAWQAGRAAAVLLPEGSP
jgi:sulfopyruvate decarboxylase TPP-binding subunit